ncbi:MAG TPA: PepSY-associated TM helix domain-containing protein [Kofleriaceae bacterium]|nr:PepSY-associated TM helix domain-containing protein [Kofleriaceae bacterium]
MPEPEAAAEIASERPAKPKKLTPAGKPQTFSARLAKRWRAWLRSLHRDIGYIAVGFTMIYAMSGIAMNHIDDWDPNFNATEITKKIAPLTDEMSDADATARVIAAIGVTSKVTDVFRAGDEVRLAFATGEKATAIADSVTVQYRRDRFFFRVADWLHATRGKQVWKYISDVYAVLLIYLAISGIFMIKGKLGLRWRGTILIVAGLVAPIGYIIGSGGPGAQKTERTTTKPGEVEAPGEAPDRPTAKGPDRPVPVMLGAPKAKPAAPDAKNGDDGITALPPDDEPGAKPADGKPAAAPAKPDAPAAKKSDDGITPLPPDDDK